MLATKFISVLCAALLFCLGCASIIDGDEDGVPGNRRVLFLTNAESGQANVHIATALTLTDHHPDVDVHLASFAHLRHKLASSSSSPQQDSSDGLRLPGVKFHVLDAPSYSDAVGQRWTDIGPFMHPPGFWGPGSFVGILDDLELPWNASAYERVYHAVREVIDRVRPTVVVVDMLFMPGIEAAEDCGQGVKRVVLSPMSLRESFGAFNVWDLFFRFPVFGSGWSYPVSLFRVPANVMSVLRLAYYVTARPNTKELRAELLARGFTKPSKPTGEYKSDALYIVSSARSIEYPIRIPSNVVEAGPILLRASPVEEQDPALAKWLSIKPTVLINLGSHFTFSEHDAIEMVAAISPFLEQGDIQVLWKFNKRPTGFDDGFLDPVRQHIRSGSLRMENWIAADIGAVLGSGHIVAVVHHGGANCFNEALSLGIPHIVLPIWLDTYDNAVRSEWLGVGIWGSHSSAPQHDRKDLIDAFDRVLGGGRNGVMLGLGEESGRIAAKARQVAQRLQGDPGNRVAARAIVDLIDGRISVGEVEAVRMKDEL